MATPSSDQALLASARAEAARMRAAVDRMPEDGAIRLGRDQFLKLARLIDLLAERDACGDADGFETPVDGIRWWVPLPVVERERDELSRLRARQTRSDLDAFLSGIS